MLIAAAVSGMGGSTFTRIGAAASLTFGDATWKATGRTVPSSATWVRVVSYLAGIRRDVDSIGCPVAGAGGRGWW